MSTFQVATEALTGASATLTRGSLDVEGGHSSLTGSGGALDGTPAAFAFSAFVGAANDALHSLQTATDGLSRALNAAAAAYYVADSTAAGALKGKS
jgi:hypothetical protein